MLAQYESEEMTHDGRARKARGPPPLTAMPCSTAAIESKRQDTNSEGIVVCISQELSSLGQKHAKSELAPTHSANKFQWILLMNQIPKSHVYCTQNLNMNYKNSLT